MTAFIFYYCPIVGILFEVLRILAEFSTDMTCIVSAGLWEQHLLLCNVPHTPT